MSIKDRCEAALMNLDKIERQSEQGTLNRAHIKRWDARVEHLFNFVVTEIGRAGDERLDDTIPLALYFNSVEDREEFVAAVQEAKPGMIQKRWPR